MKINNYISNLLISKKNYFNKIIKIGLLLILVLKIINKIVNLNINEISGVKQIEKKGSFIVF